ncbi:MAG: glycosyltransferase family 4 protein [Fusobacteriaceae bacterium]
MKILLLSSIYYPTIGGVTTYIEKLMNELKTNEISVDLICPIYIEDYNNLSFQQKNNKNIKYFIIDEFKKNDNGIITGFFRKYSYNKKSKEIYNYIVKNYSKQDTVIHQHDLISNFKLIKSLKKSEYKTILTNHTGETLLWKKIPLIGQNIIDYQFRYYDYIIGPSEELTYVSKYKEKSRYFPNSIKIDQSKLDKKCKKNTNKIYFCPRRWAPTKGIIYYLKAIKLLKEKNLDIFKKCKFIFAGNDYSDYKEYKLECEKLVAKIDSENLVLLGDIKDINLMKTYYKESDYTVIPSLYEAVSLSALEAIVEGSALIVTDVGGMKELVENNLNGFMCKSESEESLYEVILKSYNLSEVKYEKLVKTAFENIYENFNYDRLIVKHIDLYKNILYKK